MEAPGGVIEIEAQVRVRVVQFLKFYENSEW